MSRLDETQKDQLAVDLLNDVQAGMAGDKEAYGRFQEELSNIDPRDRLDVARRFEERYDMWKHNYEDAGMGSLPSLEVTETGSGGLNDIDLNYETSWWNPWSWDNDRDLYDPRPGEEREGWGGKVWTNTDEAIEGHNRDLQDVMNME